MVIGIALKSDYAGEILGLLMELNDEDQTNLEDFVKLALSKAGGEVEEEEDEEAKMIAVTGS